MIWLGALYCIAIGWLLHAVVTAPEDYEDADGFHIGPPPSDQFPIYPAGFPSGSADAARVSGRVGTPFNCSFHESDNAR